MGEIGRGARYEKSERGHDGKIGRDERSESKDMMRQLSITVVIIRAEVVKALQARSNLHRTPHL